MDSKKISPALSEAVLLFLIWIAVLNSSGFHTETPIAVAPEDESGHAEDDGVADCRTGRSTRRPGVLPLGTQHDDGGAKQGPGNEFTYA